jgi:hypothetical protein
MAAAALVGGQRDRFFLGRSQDSAQVDGLRRRDFTGVNLSSGAPVKHKRRVY